MTSRSAQEQANIDLLQGFFEAIPAGEGNNYIDQNFTDDVRFPIVITTSDYDENAHSHEANLINPGIFPFSGKEGAKEFLGSLEQFRTVLRFNIDKYIVDGNNVAAFGDYVHLSNTTDNFAVTPFALEVEILNGKIDLYHIREDSWASITAERDSGRWLRRFGEEAPLNVIFGGRFEDNLTGSDGEDLIYGYQLDDRINGGDGNDEIWGGSGNDNISGGNGHDTFVLVAGEGTDTITDFEDGTDILGLARTSFLQWDGISFPDPDEGNNSGLETISVDLNFSDLTIGTQGADATVTLTDTSEVLAVIKGAAGLINEDDFFKIPTEPVFEPPPTPEDPTQPPEPDDEARNLEVVQGFFDSILNGTSDEYIDQNFTQDVQYVVVRADNDYSETSFFHERNRILPWTTLHVGPQAVKDFTQQLTEEFNILEFNIDKLYAEGNTVVVFGDFEYQNTRTEQLAKEIPFAINIVLEDGKIDYYHFFEDSYTILTALRDDGNWNRFGQELVFGSRFEDNLTGTAGGDVIYGYQLADIINGGEGDDEIWGGSGNDNISGGNGNDTFVLLEGEGTDIIHDFTRGTDQFSLLDNLTFADLTLDPNNGDTQIIITSTSEVLALVKGVTGLDASDFGEDPSYSPEELAHINLVKSFFEAQSDGSILETASDFFAEDGRYIFIRGGEERLGRGDETGPESILSSTPTAFSESKGGLPLQGLDFKTSSFEDFPNNLNFFDIKTVPRVGGFTTEANQLDTNAYNDLSLAHERNDLIPFSDNYVGGDGVEAFYQDFFNNFEIIKFITTTEEFEAENGRPSPYPYGIIANDNNLAVYGEFEFRNKFTGNKAKSFFRIDIEFEDGPDGKIKTYQFWTDTHTLAAAMREGGSWRGQYGLEVSIIETGANPEDFRFLTVSELEATGKYEDTIFGRQYDPRGYLIQEDGTPVNDNPFQQDKVDERLFLPLYVQWGTGNNDSLSGFTDISKYFDPNLPNDQLYGLQGDDTLEGLEGDDELYGGSGDDSLIGGPGKDFLYGHTGLNTLEGGPDEDTFVLDNLFESDDPITTSTIVDFSVVEDKIGLAGDGQGNQLKFEDLEITDDGTNAEIRLKDSASAPPLAIVQNTTAAELTADKFEELRPDYTIGFTTPDNIIGDAEENKSLVLGFFQSFFTGDIFNYIGENFTEDARYIVIQGENNDYTADDAFSSERYRLSPTTKEWSLNEGAQGFIFSLFQAVDVLGTRWPDENNVTNFYIEKIVTDSVDPDNVAVFGRFLYRNNSTGILTDGPFAYNIQIKHVDDGTGQITPKIDIVSFFEDYYAFGYAARQGGTWTRNYNGELTDIIWGTTAAETLDGTARNNIIYGYQSNDNLNGKEGDDEIFGGYGDDTVEGGPGNDQLWGDGVATGTPGNDNPANNPGKDTFVLAAGEGTDTIHDFTRGTDQFSLLDNLTFADLTLNPNNGDTQIIITSTSEVLALVKGVTELDASDFGEAPGPQLGGLVFGTSNNDELNIFDGSVIVFAGLGNDIVDASQSSGNNQLFGGEGDDELFASSNDRLFGEAGNDILNAAVGTGNNRLFGGDENDILFAGFSDRLFGGNGNDLLFAGDGESLLNGGRGADQFWIANAALPSSPNTITDFELDVDVLGIGGLGLNFDDLSLTQQGKDALIAAEGQNIAILLDIDSTSLSANNFVFV